MLRRNASQGKEGMQIFSSLNVVESAVPQKHAVIIDSLKFCNSDLYMCWMPFFLRYACSSMFSKILKLGSFPFMADDSIPISNVSDAELILLMLVH